MNRRVFLQSSVIGGLSAIPGCQGALRSREPGPTVAGIETKYPELAAASYDVHASEIDDARGGHVSFEVLSDDSRLEFANAVHRGRFLTTDSALLREERHRSVVAYRGRTFDVGVGVTDWFEPTHGPAHDPDWTDPVTVAVDAGRDAFSVALTNELDVDLPVHYVGRPYFGVLVAVGTRALVLDHERYATNGHVDESGLVTTLDLAEADPETVVLETDESLRETYSVPRSLPSSSTVYLAVQIGGLGIEQFEGRPTTLTASVPVET